MSGKLRIVLLTANGLRHRYVAQHLAEQAELVGLVSEAKGATMAPTVVLSPADDAIIKQHFAERDAAEQKLLGTAASFPATKILEVPHGTINTPEVFAWVQERRPDFVLLYGSGIIKPPLLENYENRIINMHLGLSPYYRGSGTNFWPLVNREPECVGATIHLAVLRVDAGSILAQVRPEAELSDRAHELGTKTIISGVAAMARALQLFANGKICPQPQDLSIGQVYRNKDFNAEAVRVSWQHFAKGMMEEYLAQKPERCRRFPIVELLAANS